MTRYVCPICGFVHDDAAGEIFDSLPDSWSCPVCGAAKSLFEPEADEHAVESAACAGRFACGKYCLVTERCGHTGFSAMSFWLSMCCS